MSEETLLSMLRRPTAPIDVVLDTDAYNEIDDQYAIAYMLAAPQKLRPKAIYAAPFQNEKAETAALGMEKSYQEVLHMLHLAGREEIPVLRGAESYMEDETHPMDSPAARDLADRAMGYSSENPLYVLAIGAITNVASALVSAPEIRNRIVVVWLGGHAYHWPNNRGFNIRQDVAGARVLFDCGVPVVQVPGFGVTDMLRTTGPELTYWLGGKGPLNDYLVSNTIKEACGYAKGRPWSRVIWDIAVVAWVIDSDEKMVMDRIVPSPIPEYGHYYTFDSERHSIKYVYQLNRDAIFEDLFFRLNQVYGPACSNPNPVP